MGGRGPCWCLTGQSKSVVLCGDAAQLSAPGSGEPAGTISGLQVLPGKAWVLAVCLAQLSDEQKTFWKLP